jgi:hypothetical protein
MKYSKYFCKVIKFLGPCMASNMAQKELAEQDFTLTFGRKRRCRKEASSYLSLQGGFLVHDVTRHVGL